MRRNRIAIIIRNGAAGWLHWLPVAAVLLVAGVLRIGWPTLSEFKFSEARLEALVLEITREGRLPLVGVPSSAGFDHSPLSVYLYVPPFLGTVDPVPATLYGGIINTAAVALCWYLARRWPGGGRWPAVLAAVFFATSPWLVVFSRKIWQVSFVPILTLLFIHWSSAALVEGRHWNLAWATAALAALVQVHPSALALCPAFLLWLIAFRRQVKPAPLAIGGLIGLATATPFFMHQALEGWPVLAAAQSLPPARLDLSALHLAWDAFTGRNLESLAGMAHPHLQVLPQLARSFDLLGWLIVAGGLALCCRMVSEWRSPKPECQHSAHLDLILLSWLVIPLLYNLQHSLDLHLHFFAVIAPAAFLVAGRGLFILGHCPLAQPAGIGRSRRILRVAALLGLTLVVGAQVVALVLMGHFVVTHETAGGFGTPLRQYLELRRLTLMQAGQDGASEVLVVGEGDSPVVDEAAAIFDVLLRGQVAYRFVDGRTAAVFTPHPSTVLMAPGEGRARQWYDAWESLPLPAGYKLYRLDGGWPAEQFTPVTGDRLFENGIEVQGVRWQAGDPGQPSRFWLLWQPLWASTIDSHFSVRIVAPDGSECGQRDGPGYPTEGRRKGDRIISLFDITSCTGAPVDAYSARVMVYRYPDVANIPVINAAGQPIADAILITGLSRRP